MKAIVELNNKTKEKFSKKRIKAILEKTIEFVGDKRFDGKNFQLSVALVDDFEIRLLNKQYRKKDRATDVLSFAEYEKKDDLFFAESSVEEGIIFLGELIVCPLYVKSNAAEDGETFEYAMTYIISHGILHLLGFSHGKKMFSLQRAVADELAVTV